VAEFFRSLFSDAATSGNTSGFKPLGVRRWQRLKPVIGSRFGTPEGVP